jgi:hypothetical protein
MRRRARRRGRRFRDRASFETRLLALFWKKDVGAKDLHPEV